MVVVEDGEERCLRAGCAFYPTEAKVGAGTGDIAKVHQEILDPEAGAFANCGGLGRLSVRVGKAGEMSIFLCEGGEVLYTFR